MSKYFIFLFLFSCQHLFSQTILVKDQYDQEPIAGASVQNQDSSLVIKTNSKGMVDISRFSEKDVLLFKHLIYKRLEIPKNELLTKKIVELAPKTFQLDEVVFSVNTFEERKANQAQQIHIFSSKTMQFANPQTTADMLEQSGTTFVQRSQMGGGSPVLRGFEANRVLLVIDGVRMNNAIYRSGHLQNVITIDPNILDRTELVMGSGAVRYGSDALGGVLSFYTRNPEFATQKTEIFGNAMLRYSSANQEFTGSATYNLGFKKWAFLGNASYSSFGDLRAGNVRNDLNSGFWERKFYVKREDGKDVVVKNENPNLQTPVGFHQFNFLQKISYQPNPNNRFSLNLQYNRTSEVPRYDRLVQTVPNGTPSFSQWYYGEQDRFLGSLRLEVNDLSEFYDHGAITLSYQYITESRHSRRFGRSNLGSRFEQLHVMGVNIDLNKELAPNHKLNYGLETYYNKVGSRAYSLNINTLEQTSLDTRYPDGGSEYQSFAAYLNYQYFFKKWIFSSGIRYNYVSLWAIFKDKTFFPFLEDRFEQHNTAFNGNMSLIWNPNPTTRIAWIGSSGFRAPNIDDVGKVFDSQVGNVLIPNPNLRPERTYSTEITLQKSLQRFHFEVNIFYTHLSNLAVRRPTTLKGADSIIYNGMMNKVFTFVNADRAYITGGQFVAEWQANRFLRFRNILTYTYGRVLNPTLPLDHIPPLFGQFSVFFNHRKLRTEWYSRYHARKKLADYSNTGEDRLEDATPVGMPEWITLNMRGSYQIHPKLKLQFALENWLDVHYRAFSSGISGAGRSATLSVLGNF